MQDAEVTKSLIKDIKHAQSLNFTFRVYFNIESKTDWVNFLLFHSQCLNNQVSWFKHGLDDDFHINAVYKAAFK